MSTTMRTDGREVFLALARGMGATRREAAPVAVEGRFPTLGEPVRPVGRGAEVDARRARE